MAAAAAASLGALIAVASASGGGARHHPDLLVARLSPPPAVAHAGDRFKVKVRTKNSGSARARRSRTRLYLSRDSKKGHGDVLLETSQVVPRLKPRHKARAVLREMVPAAIEAGRWVLLACADDTRRVRESKEQNNCRASSRPMIVSAPPPPPPPPLPPPPAPPPPAPPPLGYLCGRTSGTAWYVKNGGSGADNGTSWANAWTSFGAIDWSLIAAGDRLYIDGGTSSVTYSSTWAIGKTGTAGHTILICPGQDAGHNGVVVFDYSALSPTATALAVDFAGHDYVELSGDYQGACHIEFDNLFNIANGTASAVIGDGSYGSADHDTVNRVRFRNDNNPVQLSYPGAGWKIQNNAMEGVRGDAAVELNGSGGGLDTIIVSGNYIEDVSQPGNYFGPDGIQTTGGVTIANNQFKQIVLNETTSDQHPDFVQSAGDNTKVYGNTFTNVGDSAFDFDMSTLPDRTPHDIYLYNNVFRIVDTIDPYPDFIRLYNGPATSITNFVIANNLFVDSSQGGGIPPVSLCYYNSCSDPATSGNQITNNVFVNDGDGSPEGAMLFLSDNAGANWVADHNVYYRSTRAYVRWKGTTYSAARFVAAVDGTGRLNLPSFVSYVAGSAANDFRLRPTDTVARDTGIKLASLFTTDALGVPRPQGAAWDRGPYEK